MTRIETVTGNARPITTGSFTGDGTTNRPIAHRLEVLPKYVYLRRLTATVDFFFLNAGRLDNWIDHATNETAVTIANTTNFYVSGNPNANSQSFAWVAFS